MKRNLTELPLFRHALFSLRPPTGGLQHWLRIEPGEARLLAWVTAIQVVMSVSSILVNNVAQATFLKRYGAEALPVVFMTEAAVTLVFTGVVSVLMERFRTIRVFTGLLLFYGAGMGLIRVLISMDAELAYPLLYILKSQAIGILPILYWDILNDMFTTQQSKRLYTLITAGGVLGTTAGSLMTRRLASWMGTNNILLLFVGGMVAAALLNELTEKFVGVPLQSRVRQRREKTGQTYLAVLKSFIEQAQTSPLLKYMIILLAIPNMILPILDFQFNVIVDRHFVSEAQTLQFFGVFRGVSNALMFALLMVSSRLITRWGVPGSLLVHPVNYCLAFGSIFLWYNLFAGVYARLTTEMLKTVLNNPARAVLYNFFPERHRAMIRLVLRGVVVRIADFAGSGFLTLTRTLVEPRMLSLVALPLALIWVVTSIRLKKAYTGILLRSLEEGRMDWNRLQGVQLQLLASDRRAIRVFQQGLASPDDKVALLCARLLAKIRPQDLAQSLIPAIAGRDAAVQHEMLALLTPENAGAYKALLGQQLRAVDNETLPDWLETVSRVDPAGSKRLMEAFGGHPDERVKAAAFKGACLSCRQENLEKYRRLVGEWLAGDAFHKRLAVSVLAQTGDSFYSREMAEIFAQGAEADVRARALESLSKMQADQAVPLAHKGQADASRLVRMAALRTLAAAETRVAAETLLAFLRDDDPGIRQEAARLLADRGGKIRFVLLTALAQPAMANRAEATGLLKEIGVPAAELSRFILDQIQKACRYLACAQVLKEPPPDSAAGLLRTCLLEKSQERVEIVLRVLGTLIFEDHLRVFLQAVQSGRRRDLDNAIEVLESTLHAELRQALIPLLTDASIDAKIAASCRAMRVSPPALAAFSQVFDLLLEVDEPGLKTLCLYAAGEIGLTGISAARARAFIDAQDAMVAEAARWTTAVLDVRAPAALTVNPPEVITKITCLQASPLLQGLNTGALLSVACQSRRLTLPAGEVLFEADQADAGVYFLCAGVLRARVPGADLLPEDIPVPGFAGEMQWIDGRPQLYGIQADHGAALVEIPGNTFRQLLVAYPLVAINLCRFYSSQIRWYHQALPDGAQQSRNVARGPQSGRIPTG